MPGADHFEISFTKKTYSAGQVREFVADAISAAAGLDETTRNRIYAVIDELSNNALEHGSSDGDEVKLRVRINSDQLEVTVDDKGNGKNPQTASQISKLVKERAQRNPLENHTKRGRGLPFIVSRWADRMEFSDLTNGGIRALFIKKL